jgi:SAM-dependent methyltransferase
MSQPDYEYHGLMAQAWDLLRGDTSGWEDRPFYFEAIRRYGEPALDVGCGTGRLLLDYLSRGIDIDGVDNSPEMIELCRRRADEMGLSPNVYVQQMENLDLPRCYRTICVPSSSFQLILEPQAATSALAGFHDHLLPGGALVMPFIVMDRPGQPPEEEWEQEATRPDGVVVRRRAWTLYDPETQLEHTRDVYELVRDGELIASETHERSPATRGYSVEQAVALVTQSGFEIERVVGGFSKRPYDPATDRVFSVIAVRPAGRGR